MFCKHKFRWENRLVEVTCNGRDIIKIDVLEGELFTSLSPNPRFFSPYFNYMARIRGEVMSDLDKALLRQGHTDSDCKCAAED